MKSFVPHWKRIEIKTLQNYSDGRLRQVGIWDGNTALSSESLTTLQGVADALDKENAPLSVVYSPKCSGINSLPTNMAQAGLNRVSVVIGQAGSGKSAELYAASQKENGSSVGIIGVVMGVLSLAKVHQAISWVGGFPTGVSMPAFGDGTLYRDIDKATIEQLDAARYIFLTTYPGIAGSYLNDSHTMDEATSDYAYIEAVRVMDKAVRGIRTYVTPELGGNVYIDADTGESVELNDNKTALDDCEFFLKKFQDLIYKSRVTYLKGKILFNLKEYEKAIVVLSDFCHQNEDDDMYSYALFYIAESLYENYQYDEAQVIYERITQDFPESPKTPLSQFRVESILQREREEKLLYLLKQTGEEYLAAKEDYERQLKLYNSDAVLSSREKLIETQQHNIELNERVSDLEKATGKTVKEAYLYLTDVGEFIQI